MNIKDAIEQGLIEKKFGGWGCYKFEHPQWVELCGLAGEQNRLEAAAAEKRRIEQEAAAAEYRRWWDSCPQGFIRFGRPPSNGASRNYRDGYDLKGISCYRIAESNGKIHIEATLTALLTGPGLIGRPAYRITGEEVGTGSDGEPLVAVHDCKKIIAGTIIVWPVMGEVEAK